MSNIEKLYLNLLSEGCYKDMPKVITSNRKLKETLGTELYMKHEDEISNYASESEKQGFIFGFQYAVFLLTSGKEVQA